MINSLAKTLIVAAASMLLLVSCSTTDTGRPQLILKSDAELEYQAKQTFEMNRKNLPLLQSRAKIDFVACVANALIEVLDEDDAAMYWELAIFDNPQVNANVMPGGKISVYDGLVDLTENQDQMATVMGHEMAHATSRHVNERASRSVVSDAGIEVAAIVLGGGYYNQTQGVLQSLKAAEQLGLHLPFNRKQEAEADEIGLLFMAKAGFDPREAVTLWKNMGKSSGGQTVPIFMQTHPSDESRLESQVDQLPAALVLYNEAQANGRNPDCHK